MGQHILSAGNEKMNAMVLKVLVSQLNPTLCDCMDCSPPSGSSVHGILQASILQWAVILFSRGSSQHRAWTQVSYIAGRFFTIWACWHIVSLNKFVLDELQFLPSVGILG